MFLRFDGRIRIRTINYGFGQVSTDPDPDPDPRDWIRIRNTAYTTLLVWAQEPVPAAGEPAEAILHPAGREGGGEGHPADQ